MGPIEDRIANVVEGIHAKRYVALLFTVGLLDCVRQWVCANSASANCHEYKRRVATLRLVL
jgi:hypothetical protein